MLELYSQEVTVTEILDMYSDPEEYFGDKTRKVSDVYKKHALAQLKKEFRTTSALIINKVLVANNYLYYPSFKTLQATKAVSGKRKTKRPDHECTPPQEIDINFLKVGNVIHINAIIRYLHVVCFEKPSFSDEVHVENDGYIPFNDK